ncbi:MULTISPECIES: GTP cyclohydrolase I [Megasphaera]|uniref:GTP cyclohydrolase 1 n=1 Tax=Megasphaera vaginalis (ex Srinivasan et al. 2021) TaxID=1111454 RepID=U7UQT1_9FIRM|nr:MULTISPECIES: GTP cyclohydrolase I FolE [Megasphaera]ERT61641.1 putative GTP cyclohydrolase I [Megasphaera vaginalis (ex Srinivasan et al. 2021)]
MARNEEAIAAAGRFLRALGLDLAVLQMEKTPERVAEAYSHFFSGLTEDPAAVWGDLIRTESKGLIAVRNIRFHSICEHHILPFFGTVQIAYFPRNGKIAGFGHFADAVDILARRPQLQERLTEEICRAVSTGVDTAGTLVIVKAKHLCLTMRNRAAADTEIVTTAADGMLCEGTKLYDQAWSLLKEEE